MTFQEILEKNKNLFRHSIFSKCPQEDLIKV